MNNAISIDRLSNEIRKVYLSDKNQADKQIERLLKQRLKNLSDPESLTVLEKLVGEFDNTSHKETGDLSLEDRVMVRISSLLLGRDVSREDLSSTELLQRLTESLNTIFDSLNQLIGVINRTLLGEHSKEQTIRTIIGFHLEGEGPEKPLESYFGQINNAFLTAQRAFKQAAQVIVGQILREIDPNHISAQGSGGLKIGPLRKAESFEIYGKKFHQIKKWYESGRFMEDFLREFEKICQNLPEA
jgi:hypothetical protein